MAMTDGQAMKIARRIQRMNEEMNALCWRLRDEHPNGEEMLDDLRDNMFDNPADATHVVMRCLSRPDDWEIAELAFGVTEVMHKNRKRGR